MTPAAKHRTRWALPVVEITAVSVLLVGDMAGVVPLSKTPFLVLLGWASLRLRKLRWRDVGLAWPPDRARALAAGCLAGVGMVLLELFVTHPLLSRLLGPPDLSDLEPVEGNLALLAVLLVAVWLLAAFGEEMAYRGYLLNRVTDLIGRSPGRWVLGLVLVSVAFGVGHLDQGRTGQLENVIDGLLLGLLYLASKRNLTVPIVAHGVLDTVDVVLIHLGHYPGL